MVANGQLLPELPGFENIGIMNEVMFILTTRCTQQCIFCCEPPSDPDMPTDKAISWLEQVRQAGVPWVDFSGGEPLLHRDIESLCRLADQIGLRITMSTNASTLQKHVDRIFPYIDQWNMSLHGMEEVHDRIVGRNGSWKTVLYWCKILSQSGATLHITYVVTEENIKDVEAAVWTLYESGVLKICFNYVFRRGHGMVYRQDRALSQEDAVRIVRNSIREFVVEPFTVYHNLNLNGQCALIRWNGDVWAVPMSNSLDFERVSRVDRLIERLTSYPYIRNHKKYTFPRLGPVQRSDTEFDMTPEGLLLD